MCETTDILWQRVCSAENISRAVSSVLGYVKPERHADRLSAAKRRWLERRGEHEARLAAELASGSYGFGPYRSMVVNETKRREIHYHADFEDNIKEVAVLQVVSPLYMAAYSPSSYGSIEGRGLTRAAEALGAILREHPDAYYLQTDHRRYYASIDHGRMLEAIARTVPSWGCVEFMRRLLESFDPGLPIGVPSGHHNGNLLLTGIDRWLDGCADVTGHVRNMDDRVIVVPDKAAAWRVLDGVRSRSAALGLELKPNWRIAPVRCGIDALGYVSYPTHRRVRRRLKLNMRRKSNRLKRRGASDSEYRQAMASHYGWCVHANARHLLQTVMGDKLKLFAKMKIHRRAELKPQRKFFGLDKARFISITELTDREVLLLEVQPVTIRGEAKTAIKLCLTSELGSDPDEAALAAASRYTITRSEVMRDRLAADSDILPFAATVRKVNNKYWCYE